jgi:hypothetical protein
LAAVEYLGMSDSSEVVLDPYSCIAQKVRKYAAETGEVHLANKGGTTLSESFKHFVNLEVVWFNNNKLSRLDNLEACFRIREIYIQNNKIASLNWLKQFKFLRVLLASNNQIRNLDKQLLLLTRLSFLRKLDLFDNSVADEPDYRLRMIYHCPQVEILDRTGVTLQQRQRADEVVPNMDKVAAAPPVRAVKKAYTFTTMERDCFRTAKAVRTERQRVEDDALRTQVFAKSGPSLTPESWFRCRHLQDNTLRWSDPGRIVAHELKNPTPWEKIWKDEDCGTHKSMHGQIVELAGKEELNKDEMVNLAQQLHEEGLEDAGRQLVRPNVFESAWYSRQPWYSKLQPLKADERPAWFSKLEAVTQDPEATMAAKDVATFLLNPQWTHLSNETLDKKIGDHGKVGKLAFLRSTFGVSDIQHGEEGDRDLLHLCRDKTARLEGTKTRKSEVGLKPKPPGTILTKSRSDTFAQSFLRPVRGIDATTGRTAVWIEPGAKTTTIVSHLPKPRNLSH